MIVMKFGGTSVENAAAIDRVASIVRRRLDHHRPVVVVSALAGITDSLIDMSQEAANGDAGRALRLFDALHERHRCVAAELMHGEIGQAVLSDLEAHLARLRQVLCGVAAVNELSPRTSDYVLGFGETLSTVIVTAAFRVRGIRADAVDARECIVTDATYTRAVPQFDITNARLKKRLSPLLEEESVPVLGGFIAATSDGIPTTLGRGGSDFSAAIVGAALSAKRIEIWTDVQGMMTTDPRLCADAQRIDSLGFDEAAELAYFGAKVLHPATLIPAVKRNIPVWVLNSHEPSGRGTCIRARTPRCPTLFRAIAAKKGITVVTLKAPRELMASGVLASVFSAFKRHKCTVDLVSTSNVSVSVAIESLPDSQALVAELKEVGEVEVEHQKAIVCLVGENIRGKIGLAARVFHCVADAKVNVHMISQGASEINISLVVDEGDVPAAVRHLHSEFFKTQPAAPEAGRALTIHTAAAAVGAANDAV